MFFQRVRRATSIGADVSVVNLCSKISSNIGDGEASGRAPCGKHTIATGSSDKNEKEASARSRTPQTVYPSRSQLCCARPANQGAVNRLALDFLARVTFPAPAALPPFSPLSPTVDPARAQIPGGRSISFSRYIHFCPSVGHSLKSISVGPEKLFTCRTASYSRAIVLHTHGKAPLTLR